MKLSSSKLEALDFLVTSLVFFEPAVRIPKLITSTGDIYRHRMLLKRVPFSAAAFGHLAQVIRNDVAESRRFRKFDCLSILRAMLLNGGSGLVLRRSAVADLFYVYRALILRASPETQWCLSRLLRDQALPAEAIEWLLGHWRESEHVVNRLLRYPACNDRIRQWAAERYRNAELSNRRSEVVAILVDEPLPAAIQKEKPETLAWAIWYSRLPRKRKIALLRTLGHRLSPELLVDLSTRLGSTALIRDAIKRTREGQHATLREIGR